MDLAAYAQIGRLEEVAKNNGIEVPRLRGYRIMSEEAAYTKEQIDGMIHEAEIFAADEFCEAVPMFSMNPWWTESSWKTDMRKERLLIRKTEQWECGPHRETVGIRWDKIHGKKRKVLKYMIKKSKKAVMSNIAAWNRHAGEKDVLYIHARIGGGNWSYYGGEEIEKKPWFIEKADDLWDSTYCDIYARVDMSRVEKEDTE